MELARIDNQKKVPTGAGEDLVISEASFRAQQKSWDRDNQGPPAKKRKRESKGDSSIVYGPGAYKGPFRSYQEVRPDADTLDDVDAEEVEEIEEVSEYEEDALPEHSITNKLSKAGTAYGEYSSEKETTEFFGQEERDYQGRTYLHVPRDLNVNLTSELPPWKERKNYAPKKLIHTWKSPMGEGKAHAKSVTQTRFFPDSGHLLLSSGADGRVLLWDVYHERKLLRGYFGHNRSACDIDFSPDGTRILSASYDRHIKFWDTETGACISRYAPGATPHVVRFNPSSPHEFIAGMGNNKILQYDTRADTKPTQEYDHHLGPINTLIFCDEDRRFMSTSDDKSVRAWEYGIPVPIKTVAEPELYALNRGSKHPNEKAVAYQSADNQILVYSADKFKQNRKKSFRGHNTAGYAIDVAVSPDGAFVASGDSAGYACFWDFKTCRLLGKVEATKGSAVVSVGWHPRETSKVVTGSVDGVLRYWD